MEMAGVGELWHIISCVTAGLSRLFLVMATSMRHITVASTIQRQCANILYQKAKLTKFE